MKGRRLGFGDYVFDGPNPLARFYYLHAVSEFVPQAIRELVEISSPTSDEERVRSTALKAWADTWGFSDEWALEVARVHAERWRDDPTTFGIWSVAIAAWTPSFAVGPSWNPITESESTFRRRVGEYIESIKKTPGISRAPEKRGGPDHFKWLALHHVGRQTYEQIAEPYGDGLNIGSVSEAITQTAATVGLTLRSRPGRNFGQRVRH